MSAACHQIQGLIPSAVRGELDESARAAVAAHARDCAECAASLTFHKRLHAAIVQDPLASPPPVYFEGVLEEIHRRMPLAPPALPLRRRRIDRQMLASVLVATLVLVWFGSGLVVRLPGLLARREGHPTPAARLVAAGGNSGAVPLVVVKGYGLLAANSVLWDYPPELRRDIGLPATLKPLITLPGKG